MPSFPPFRLLLAVVLTFAALSAVADDSAPQPMLAGRYHEGIDPAAYWVSEKYDGVRARWDGHALRLRNGLWIQSMYRGQGAQTRLTML